MIKVFRFIASFLSGALFMQMLMTGEWYRFYEIILVIGGYMLYAYLHNER